MKLRSPIPPSDWRRERSGDCLKAIPRQFSPLASKPLAEEGYTTSTYPETTATEPRGGRLKSYLFRACRSIRRCGATTPRANGASLSHPIAKERCVPVVTTMLVKAWNETASRLHFNRDFRINSQSLTACLTSTKAIGGRAWPNFIPARDEWTVPLILWANTTLGLLAFWWIGTRQQQGRTCLTITQLPHLTVLDPRTLSEAQIAQAEDIFEAFKEAEFLPANEAYRDDTRKALDRAVLVDLLRLPEVVLGPLSILRDQWCAEPTVHGGKSTRIDV